MRCIGITKKFKRCRNTSVFLGLFCKHHKFQPIKILFAFCSIATVFSAFYYDIINPFFPKKNNEVEVKTIGFDIPQPLLRISNSIDLILNPQSGSTLRLSVYKEENINIIKNLDDLSINLFKYGCDTLYYKYRLDEKNSRIKQDSVLLFMDLIDTIKINPKIGVHVSLLGKDLTIEGLYNSGMLDANKDFIFQNKYDLKILNGCLISQPNFLTINHAKNYNLKLIQNSDNNTYSLIYRE